MPPAPTPARPDRERRTAPDVVAEEPVGVGHDGEDLGGHGLERSGRSTRRGAPDGDRGSGRRRGRGQRGEDASDAAGDDVEADPEGVARTIVLRKLAVQARTRHELAKALATREVPEDVAEAVLDRMEEVGLVDDEAFARDWVESRQQRRHLSRSALRRELQTKGVDRDQIDEAVGGVETDDEIEAALALATKKLRTLQGLERDVQYRRLAGSLARRGFSGGVAATVLSQVLDRPRD